MTERYKHDEGSESGTDYLKNEFQEKMNAKERNKGKRSLEEEKTPPRICHSWVAVTHLTKQIKSGIRTQSNFPTEKKIENGSKEKM